VESEEGADGSGSSTAVAGTGVAGVFIVSPTGVIDAIACAGEDRFMYVNFPSSCPQT
jgi:hypothetical protein